DTTAEIAQAIANTDLTDMPRLCATCWLNAVARIARPRRENLKNQAKPAMITTEITSDMMYGVCTFSPKTLTAFVPNTSGKGLAKTPNIHFIIAWKKIDRP